MCSVPALQLVQFYENQTYKTNSDNTQFKTESTGSSNDMSDDSNDDMVFMLSTNCKGQSCQKANIPNFQKPSTPKKSQDTVSSQIVIVSSKELLMSSDESSTIDVGTECSQPNAGTRNPWGDMDINDVPIEIVDDLIFSGDEETTFTDELDIIKKSKAPPVMFNLLTLEVLPNCCTKIKLGNKWTQPSSKIFWDQKSMSMSTHDNTICPWRCSLSFQFIFHVT